ncbi:MAG: pentapeptide repeat-containing protein [Spirochaeta sp.]|nr:pentapeptide repeat-containing protein [Spirochaeta sp.]
MLDPLLQLYQLNLDAAQLPLIDLVLNLAGLFGACRFRGCRFRGCRFRGCGFRGCGFRGCGFSSCRFHGPGFPGPSLLFLGRVFFCHPAPPSVMIGSTARARNRKRVLYAVKMGACRGTPCRGTGLFRGFRPAAAAAGPLVGLGPRGPSPTAPLQSLAQNHNQNVYFSLRVYNINDKLMQWIFDGS